MRKFLSIIYKDYLFLTRDIAGLIFMFFMPIALVVLMAYLQDSTYNSVNESKIPLLLLNQDNDSLGCAIEKSVQQTGIFSITTELNGEPLTSEALQANIAEGNYLIGIVIPAETTKKIRRNIRGSVIHTFNPDFEPKQLEPNKISIFIDPTAKESFKTAITSSINEYAARLQTQIVMNEVVAAVNQQFPLNIGNFDIPTDIIKIDEQYARSNPSAIMPNSVQHNVPAWGLFAVFFIVISLANNIIKERDDGSYLRIKTMPCPTWLYFVGKISIYLIVCLLQMAIMILMGIFVMPLLGLPQLELGHSIRALLLISVSAAMAAIGYGTAIGTLSTNSQQASIFGSVSVVILSAIGGIWIPTIIMPHVMQIISHISPLNWGLSGFYDIFVRDSGIASVLPESGLLLAFGGVSLAIALIYNKQKCN